LPYDPGARVTLLLLVVTLAGAALRIAPALLWPIRHDEVLTWLTAQADPSAFLLWTHHPHHPPLSFALVRLSTGLTGTDAEWALRLPSLLAGIACIPVAYAVGRALGTRAGGILLALLIALDPLLVDQARQARMYSLYALLFLAALYALVRIRPGRDGTIPRWRWVVAGLGLAATFWTHVLGLILWGGVGLGIVTGRGEGGRRGAALKAMALAVLISLVGLEWTWNHAWDTVRSSASGHDGLGPSVLALRGLDSIYPGRAVALLLLLAALSGLIRLHRRDPFLSRLLLGLFILSILAAVVGAGDREYGVHRYLLPLHLTAHVGLVGLAVSRNQPRMRGAVFAAVVLVALLGGKAVLPGAEARRANAVGTLTRELAERHVRPGHGVKYVPRLLHQQGRYYGLPYELYVTVGRPLPADYPFDTTWVVAGYGRALPDHSPDLPVTLNPELPYVLGPVARHYGVSYDERTVEELLVEHGAVAVEMSRAGVRYVVPVE
jgi:4-amino-4-deoxy-L-arabinose transferase-like glycosyltransferase